MVQASEFSYQLCCSNSRLCWTLSSGPIFCTLNKVIWDVWRVHKGHNFHRILTIQDMLLPMLVAWNNNHRSKEWGEWKSKQSLKGSIKFTTDVDTNIGTHDISFLHELRWLSHLLWLNGKIFFIGTNGIQKFENLAYSHNFFQIFNCTVTIFN